MGDFTELPHTWLQQLGGTFRDYTKGANGRQGAPGLPCSFYRQASRRGGSPAAKPRSTFSAPQMGGLGHHVGPNSLPPNTASHFLGWKSSHGGDGNAPNPKCFIAAV